MLCEELRDLGDGGDFLGDGGGFLGDGGGFLGLGGVELFLEHGFGGG